MQWRAKIIEDKQLNVMILYQVEFMWKSIWFKQKSDVLKWISITHESW